MTEKNQIPPSQVQSEGNFTDTPRRKFDEGRSAPS